MSCDLKTSIQSFTIDANSISCFLKLPDAKDFVFDTTLILNFLRFDASYKREAFFVQFD